MARKMVIGGFVAVYKLDNDKLSFGGITGIVATDASLDRLWGVKRLVNVPLSYYLHKPALWSVPRFICAYTWNKYYHRTIYCCLFSKLHDGELLSVYNVQTGELIIQLFRRTI